MPSSAGVVLARSISGDAFPSYDLGPLGQPSAVLARDAGMSGVVGGRSLWAFGDSLFAQPSSDGQMFRTNTGAIDVAGYYPLAEPLDGTGAPATQLVPYSAAEQSYNATHTMSRYHVWPTAVIGRDPQDGLIFFQRDLLLNNVSVPGNAGVGIADVTPGSTAASRRPSLLFGPEDCLWGGQFVGEDGYLYAYSNLNVAGRDNCPQRAGFLPAGVARAPLASSGTRSAYRFWNGTAWTTDQTQTATIIQGMPNDMGVAWNATLGKYLTIFGFGGDQAMYATAVAPQGPWSPVQQFATGLPPVGGGWGNYAWRQHPEYASANDGVVMVSYLHPISSTTAENRLLAVDLRSGHAAGLDDYVNRSYATFLNYQPLPADRAYWAGRLRNHTISTRDFSQYLATSEDGRRRRVRKAYLDVLGRSADSSGLAYWAGQLALPGWGDDVLVSKLAAMPEFSDLYPSNSAYVTAVFPLTVGRAVDPSGLSYWTGRLNTGLSRYHLVRALTAMEEAGRWQARQAYTSILGRSATSVQQAHVAAHEYESTRIRNSVNTTVEAVG